MIQPFTPTLFFNHCFDKRRFQHFLYWFFRKSRHGHSRTLQFLEKLKSLGFQSATEAGFSISIEDLKIPSTKSSILFTAENILFEAEFKNTSSCLTAIEKSQQILEIWNRTSERLKHEVLTSFQISDFLNPVYLMAFSGARGNISQIRQLIGMRGLMADPQGQIVDFPIRSNFREGLTLTEYLISCSGARKGIVDTALRTAASGYLTRRLVDVAHHVIIGQLDCQTSTGVFLEDLYDQHKKILTLKERLIGRILAENIYSKQNNTLLIGSKNQEITQKLSLAICQHRQKVFIRSPLTCQSSQFTCQLCYGWNLAEGQFVSIGEAIGILAAQSIGEPGTQLTMRTFHTGGVFTGTLTDQTYASLTGHIYYSAICPGLLIRTQQGQIAFLTKKKSVLNILPIKEKFLRSKREQHLQQFFLASFSKPYFWKKNQPDKLSNGLPRAFSETSFDKKSKDFPIQFQNQIKNLSLKLQCISSIASISYKHQLLLKKQEVSWIFQASTLLYVRQGETVEKQQLISEFPSYTEVLAFESEQEILSSASGEIFFDNFVFLEKTKFDIKYNIQFYQKTVQGFGEFWILFGHVLQIWLPTLSTFFKKYDIIGRVPCSQIFIKSGLEILRLSNGALNFQKNLKCLKKLDFIFFKRKGYLHTNKKESQRTVLGAFLQFETLQNQKKSHRWIEIFQKNKIFSTKAFILKVQQSLGISLKVSKQWKAKVPVFLIFQNQQSSFFRFHISSFIILLNRQGLYSQRAAYTRKIDFSKVLVEYTFNTLENTHFSWIKRASKSTKNYVVSKNWNRKSFLNSENVQWIFYFLFFKAQAPQLLPKFPTKMERQKVVWKPLIFYTSLSSNDWNKQFNKKKTFQKMRIGTFSFLRISIFLMNSSFGFLKPWISKTQTAFEQFFIKKILSKSASIVISKQLIQKVLFSFIFQLQPIQSSIQDWGFFGEGSLDKQKQNSTFFKKFVNSRSLRKKKPTFFSIRKIFFKPDRCCRFFLRKEILDLYFDFFLYITQKFYFLRSMKTRFDPLMPAKSVYFVFKKQPKNKFYGLFFYLNKKRGVNKKKKPKEYSIRSQKSKLISSWLGLTSEFDLERFHNNTKSQKTSFFNYIPNKNLGNLYYFWIPSKKKKTALKKIKLRIFCFIKNKILKKKATQTRRVRKGLSKKSQFYSFNIKKLLWDFQIEVQGIYPVYKKLPFLKNWRGLHTIEQKTLFLKSCTLNLRTLHWNSLLTEQKNGVHFEIISKKEHFRNFENQIWIRYFLTTQMGEILEMIMPKSKQQEILVLEFSDLFSYEYKKPFEKNKNPCSQKIFTKNTSKFLGSFLQTGEELISNEYILITGQMIAKTEQSILFRKADSCLLNDQSVLYVKHGEILLKDQRLCTIFYNQPKTGDIVQGIPKIEEIFEARKKSKYSLHRLAIFSKDFLNFEKKITQYLRSLQKSVVNNIQRIYCGQGVYISDKHIEIIVRQMTSNVWIVDPGQTGLLYGEILPLHWIERINSLLISNQVLYEPILLGMTKTCLEASSFLSAASFQETTRVLGRAALQNQIDFVRGLKQNIILGNFIPAGTGCFGRTPQF